MASSKDKAIALKDNYVAGLIEAGATAPMPTMPEQDMGEQASVHMDARTGRTLNIDDGIPDVYIHDYRTGRSAVSRNAGRRAAYPVDGDMWYTLKHGSMGSLSREPSLHHNDYTDVDYKTPKDEISRRRRSDNIRHNIERANNPSPYSSYQPTQQVNMNRVPKGKFIKHFMN